jgi:5'/3'-nucleotidase SurE
MKKISEIESKPGRGLRGSATAILVVALSAILSGCYLIEAKRDFDRDGPSAALPWWCAGGSPELTQGQCLGLSLSLDGGVVGTYNYPTVDDFETAGAVEIPILNRPANIGVAFTKNPALATFNPNVPNVLLYSGTSAASRLVGVAWEIDSDFAPDGFAGDRDAWTQNATTGNWWLTAWVIRGHQNHANVFATSHPCLTSTASILTSTSDTCFAASHTEPLEILVTNDDGFAAPGIDALVEGLYALNLDLIPGNDVVVNIVAPFANQSGSSDVLSPVGNLSASAVVTASGKAATAISSTDLTFPRSGSGSPADAARWALTNMKLSPEIVLSGINKGQNIGVLSEASGTIGAARTARRNGVPAIATSQGGFSAPNDFPTGVTATLALLEDWRLGLTVNTTTSVSSINIPTCVSGLFPRGTVNTVVAKCPAVEYGSNCASTEEVANIDDDVEAFNHGFISITDVGTTANSCPP